MKIALLTEKYTPDIGGLAISAERLGRLLSMTGIQVHVISPSPNLPASETLTLTHGCISVTRFGTRKRVDDTLVDWFDLIVEGHRSDPFNLIHAYFLPQAGFLAAYAGNYLGLPSVVSARGNDLDRAVFDPARAVHVMYALQYASAVTTNAYDLVKKAKALVNREVIWIPNGIDAGLFKPMIRNAEVAKMLGMKGNIGDEKRISVVGFAGELREKKGLKTILSSCAQLSQRRPIELLIVGEVRPGDDKQFFDEFRSLHPDLPITITGYIPYKDMPAFYALMDVFVQPSLRDGMPNALLEAMACEKAVVATPVGGITDVLEKGRNGIFVNANNADALADVIDGLLDDVKMRERLGKAARESILEGFTPEKEMQANLEVYRKLGL